MKFPLPLVVSQIVLSLTIMLSLFAALSMASGDDATANSAKLWAALSKSMPADGRKIDVYCENDSSTSICFSSNGSIYLFTIDKAAPELLKYQIVLKPINRISFEKGIADDDHPNQGAFVLWSNGEVQMRQACYK